VILNAKMKAKKKRYPRGSGISVSYRKGRVCPWYVQWKVAGQRLNRSHATKENADAHAATLEQNFKRDGQSALEFGPKELRDWRAFRVLVGEDASLEELAMLWKSYGGVKKALLGPMIERFLKDLEAANSEGGDALSHMKPVMRWLENFFGAEKPVGLISDDDLRELLASYPPELKSTFSKQAYLKKARQFFNYLENKKAIPTNRLKSFDAPKPTKAELEPKPILTPQQARNLLYENLSIPNGKEIIGRLALELFSGMRNATAGKILGEAINLDEQVVQIKAEIDKMGKRYEISGNAPEKNFWEWLQFSEPKNWTMTKRQYFNAKKEAFVRAKVPHPRNVLRHTFATYHISLHGDASKTIILLNHHEGSVAQLKAHYLQRGTGVKLAKSFFDILPPENSL